MARFALKIEYHGEPFAGWQRQAEHFSVQEAVEVAIRRLEPDAPGIAAAGRTDAGVHALGQVAHCDLAKHWDPYRLREALNYHLKPHPVAIVAVGAVDDDWHARFSATERSYTYRLISRRAPLVHERGLAWRVAHGLDRNQMLIGAQHLIGRHDFTTFRSTMCQAKDPDKTIDSIEITESPIADGIEYGFHIHARSFLHNQVRSIVGTLERVGAGGWGPERVRTALEACDRASCGPVAPSEGLYLTKVTYPDDPFGD